MLKNILMCRILLLICLIFSAATNCDAKFFCKDIYPQVGGFPIPPECRNVLHLKEEKEDFLSCTIDQRAYLEWGKSCNFNKHIEKISTPIEVVSLGELETTVGVRKTISKSKKIISMGEVFRWDSEQFSGILVYSSQEEKLFINILH